MLYMRNMTHGYGRNLDLNLLRVFVVVAERGSVTAAASELYLTQPAVSAALRRLNEAVGAPLFARQGRGLALTNRGQRLFAEARAHLGALVDAALSPGEFDPKTHERTFRIGLSDVSEASLVPELLRLFEREAPRMRLVVLPVQFRTVGEALATRRVDLAVTVADELPTNIRRKPLTRRGEHVCLFDPRKVRVGASIDEEAYFAHQHVIVSYNGDLRGVVEDLLHRTRDVRCSVSGFAYVGKIVDGTSLLATVPSVVADYSRRSFPHLRTAKLPFEMTGAALELLWPATTDDDPALRFLRDAVERVSWTLGSPSGGAQRERRAERGAKQPTRAGRTSSSPRSASRGRRRGA